MVTRPISFLIARVLSVLWPLFFLVALRQGGWWPGVFTILSLLFAIALWTRFLGVEAAPLPPAAAGALPPTLPDRPRAALSRQLTLETLFLGVAMLLQRWVFSYLMLTDFSFTLREPVVQRLYAGGVAAVVAAVFLGLVVAFSALVVVNLDLWDLANSPGSAPLTLVQSWRRALARAVRLLLGGSGGTVILDRGVLRRPDGQQVGIEATVGPNFIDAREGQVAIVETNGIVSHAVNGRVWLDANQRVTGMADLANRTVEVTVTDAPTRDAVIIRSFTFSVRYAVGLGLPPDDGSAPDSEPRAWSGQYEYKPRLIQKNHWKDDPESFRTGVQRAAQSVARALISSCDLLDLAILPGPRRAAFEQQFCQGIQERLDDKGEWINVRGVAIGLVALPEPAFDQTLARWVADVQARTARIMAAADRDTMILKGEGQAGALRAVEDAKTEARQNILQLVDLIITHDPEHAKLYLENLQKLLAYLSQDSVRALEFAASLKQMARDSQHFNLNVMSADLLQPVAPAGSAAVQPTSSVGVAAAVPVDGNGQGG